MTSNKTNNQKLQCNFKIKFKKLFRINFQKYMNLEIFLVEISTKRCTIKSIMKIIKKIQKLKSEDTIYVLGVPASLTIVTEPSFVSSWMDTVDFSSGSSTGC